MKDVRLTPRAYVQEMWRRYWPIFAWIFLITAMVFNPWKS